MLLVVCLNGKEFPEVILGEVQRGGILAHLDQAIKMEICSLNANLLCQVHHNFKLLPDFGAVG